MNKRTFLLSWLMASLSVSAQTLPARPAGALPSLHNPSQPAKAAPEKAAATEPEKLLESPAAPALPSGSKVEQGDALPYGAGFERRQQGMGAHGGGRGGRGR